MNVKIGFPPVSGLIEARARALSLYNFHFESVLQKISEDKKFAIYDIHTRYQGDEIYIIEFTVKFHIEEEYVELLPSNCTCPHDIEVCKHLYAAILNFVNIGELENQYAHMQIYTFNPQSEVIKTIPKPILTSSNTQELVNKVVASTVAKLKAPLYKLTPELTYEYGKFKLKLKIDVLGAKSFVVRNIYELPELFAELKSEVYGLNTEVIHNINLFENRDFTQFILDQIEIGNNLLSTVRATGSRDWYGYDNAKVKYDKKTLPLNPHQMSKLIVALDNQTIKVKYKEERAKRYEVSQLMPKIKFDIKQSGESVTLSNSQFEYIKCLENKMILVDKQLGQIALITYPDQTISEIIYNLLIMPNSIGADLAASFERSIISRIKDYVDIDFDFLELYDELEVVGFKTHIEMTKDTLYVTTKLDSDESLESQLLSGKVSQEENAVIAEIYEKKPEQDETYKLHVSGIDKLISFVTDKLPTLEKVSATISANQQFKDFKVIRKIPVTSSTRVENGKTILKLSSSEFSDSELLEVLKALESSDKYMQISSGKVIDLTSADVQAIISNANKLDLDIANAKSTEFEIELASVFYYNKIFSSIEVLLESDQTVTDLVNDYNNISAKYFSKDEKLIAKLHEYQKLGVNWIKFLEKYGFGGILADDMGLGKTLQVIVHLASIETSLPTLIITPASLVYNWKYEFEKFTKEISPLVIDGSAEKRQELIESIDRHICIISYDAYKRDFPEISKHKFNYVVLDEAQHIKNAHTKVSKAVKAIDCEHRLALTGTPIENNLNDLWSLFEFVMPSFLGTSRDFKKNYITPISNGDSDASIDLRRKVNPFIMRRLKTEVLTELPDKSEKVIHIMMDEDQQKIYDAQVSVIKQFIEKSSDTEINKSQIEILAMITKLRQIACNPMLINKNYRGTNAKLEYIADHIDSLIAGGHKTVIFSQFTSNFKYLENMLIESGIKYYKITGETQKEKRYKLVDKFNTNDIPIFLISLKAGGTGLNITGADTVIHYDPWWNTAVESQATDRVHRIGQTKSVFVYKLICEKTIEEQILEMQEAKRELAKNLLESEPAISLKLTKAEILSLF